MTPKEKALELFNLFKPIVFGDSKEVKDYNAKKAAQIAVGLIVSEILSFDNMGKIYWEQVSKEIELLQ
jgi:hypothetical protein